jgi:hypothetical protein
MALAAYSLFSIRSMLRSYSDEANAVVAARAAVRQYGGADFELIDSIVNPNDGRILVRVSAPDDSQWQVLMSPEGREWPPITIVRYLHPGTAGTTIETILASPP